jgi:hypothetical protein
MTYDKADSSALSDRVGGGIFPLSFMNMMYASGFGALFGIIHATAAFAVLSGVLLLLFFAFKHLSEKQLKTWGLSLLAGGLLVCLLTSVAGGQSGRKFKLAVGHHDEIAGMRMKALHKMGGEGMGMSMDDMTMMLKGKTGDDFDKAFIEMMIDHHQGAIDMANEALKNAEHEEIKTLSTAIIDAQQKEIDEMKEWQQTWGYDEGDTATTR